MNRRDFGAFGSGAAVGTQWVPLEASKGIELPLYPGDEIVTMTVHRDEICVASKRGHIYWIRPA